MDRLPVLLIANLHDIRCTSLSGSSTRLPSIPTKQTMAMDFIYAEETVCWIDVGDTPASTQLKCASIQDLKTVSNIRTINITLSLHREYLFYWQNIRNVYCILMFQKHFFSGTFYLEQRSISVVVMCRLLQTHKCLKQLYIIYNTHNSKALSLL